MAVTITRRGALIGLSASFVTALGGAHAFADGRSLYAAARREADGRYSAVIFDGSGEDVAVVPLPDRGHDIALRPGTADCVAIARRPGGFGVAFSANGRPPVWFAAAPGRHFYGHAVFSDDGRLLYTSENDYEAGRGVIGVRDAQAGYAQIGEFPAYGIDPHDMAIIGGTVMVVANGGIATHLDSGRAPLNIAAMEASLVYIALGAGALLEKVTLDGGLRKLSIRHLAVAGCNRVVFGCQYEGAAEDLPPLIGFHDRGRQPVLARAPDAVHQSLKNYIGSVSSDRSGEVIAASSPRGGVVTFWDAATARYLGSRGMEDVCGVADAPRHRSFLLTTGLGIVEEYDSAGGGLGGQAMRSVSWDNHVLRIG